MSTLDKRKSCLTSVGIEPATFGDLGGHRLHTSTVQNTTTNVILKMTLFEKNFTKVYLEFELDLLQVCLLLWEAFGLGKFLGLGSFLFARVFARPL